MQVLYDQGDLPGHWTWTPTGSSDSKTFYILTPCYLQVRHMKNSQNFTTTLLMEELFFNVVSIYVNILLPPLNNSRYSHLVTAALFPLQPKAHAILQCLIICVNSASLSEDQTTQNLVWHQDCRIRAATLSVQILWWCQWCAHFCVAWHCHRGATLLLFFLWDKFNDGDQLDFSVFQYSGHSSMLSLCTRIAQASVYICQQSWCQTSTDLGRVKLFN
jgi:hypothetical protein